MRIDQSKCIGCGSCRDHCTMSAGIMRFQRNNRTPSRVVQIIDEDECVECSVCLRSGCCPTGALYQPPITWPRIVRKNFSDPLKIHPETQIPGRGTEEMKTNDVTGRYRKGMFGLAVELGRPGIGARFSEVQKVTKALAGLNVLFEENNPLTKLMINRREGTINPEVLEEKVLSAIVEFAIPENRLKEVMAALVTVSKELQTVFSGDIIARADEQGSTPCLDQQDLRCRVSINGKSNVGLGRPLAQV